MAALGKPEAATSQGKKSHRPKFWEQKYSIPFETCVSVLGQFSDTEAKILG